MTATASPGFSLQKAAPYLALSLAVLAVYSNVFGGAFVYDDQLLLVNNAFIRSWQFVGTIFRTHAFNGANVASNYYRPVQILVYLAIYQMAGLSLFAFHALNVALQIGNTCLVYCLGRKLGFDKAAVFLAALIWGLHPLYVEIVANVAGAGDELDGFFSLISLLILLPDFSFRRLLISIPFLALALLSKEEAISLPLVAMSCIFFIDPDRYNPRRYVRTWPLWLTVAIYLVGHTLMNMHGGGPAAHGASTAKQVGGLYFSMAPYTVFAALTAFARLMVWPTNLHCDRTFPAYPTPWHWDVGFGMLLVLAAFYIVFWRQDKRNLPLRWAIVWFATAYFLYSGIPLNFAQPVVEHFMYLPSVGLFLGLAQSIDDRLLSTRSKQCAAVVAVFAATALGLCTHLQNRVWHDPETLYLHIFATGEKAPKAHNNLGTIYAQRGADEAALEQYRLAIEFSDDTLPEAQYNLATLLLKESDGNTTDALRHLKRALDIDPSYYPADVKLAEIYRNHHDAGDADLYQAHADELRNKTQGTAP